MKFRCLAAAFALCASACTFTPARDGGMDAQFHPPIVKRYWQMQPFTLANGERACNITSGYNGLSVLLSHPQGQEPGVVVKSNRRMEPGTTLTVTVNGGNYETEDQYFSATLGRELLEQFKKGGKAYFDWSEIMGPPGPGRIHVTNIVQLDNFAPLLQQCEVSFHTPPRPH